MSDKDIKEIVKSRRTTAEQRGKKNDQELNLADSYEDIIKNNTKEETISLLADENNRSINAVSNDLENAFFVRRLIELNNLNLSKTDENYVKLTKFESSPIELSNLSNQKPTLIGYENSNIKEFLILNKNNFTTRGWKKDKIYLLNDFYLQCISKSKDVKTLEGKIKDIENIKDPIEK